jgi:hypothetical protein
MIIRLLFEKKDVPENITWPVRIAERDFEWEEGMGNIFAIANPHNPEDILGLEVYDNEPGEDGQPICSVVESEENIGQIAIFEDILRYGFVEVKWCMNSDCRVCSAPGQCCLRGFFQ